MIKIENLTKKFGAKTVLDNISAEKVADWDSKAAGDHEHDITELKQASGYIVFNCGSASVNI